MNLILHKKYLNEVYRSLTLSAIMGMDGALVIMHDTGNLQLVDDIVRIPAYAVQDPDFHFEYDVETSSFDDTIKVLSGNNHVDVHMTYTEDEYFQMCLIHKYVYPPDVSNIITDILKATNAKAKK